MIEITALGKSYGLKPVLRGVDLSIARGEFVTLVGPNGAGKTTLLRIVATLMRPTVGRVSIAGLDLAAQAHAVRPLLGVVSHQTMLYDTLTAKENLHFYARLYGLKQPQRRSAAVLDLVGLSRLGNELVRTFSRGMQQRLAIARALLHEPPVLLLDEPYTGLDQDAAAILDEMLTAIAAVGRTVLMTTHDLARGLAVSDRLAVLSRGRIALQQTARDTDPATFAHLYATAVHG